MPLFTIYKHVSRIDESRRHSFLPYDQVVYSCKGGAGKGAESRRRRLAGERRAPYNTSPSTPMAREYRAVGMGAAVDHELPVKASTVFKSPRLYPPTAVTASRQMDMLSG